MGVVRLKTKGSVPYGGAFSLNLREQGLVGFGTNFEMLSNNVREYRRANAIPIGLDFDRELEAAVCRFYPNECTVSVKGLPDRQRRLGWQDVLTGTKAFLAFKLAGDPLVSQTEADRRAAICAACPQNNDFSRPCGFLCGELKEIVQRAIGPRTTPYDGQLKSCMICGCFNAAAVHVDLGVQLKALNKSQKEQFALAKQEYGCWKNELTGA